MALNPVDLDALSSDDLKAMRVQYRDIKKTASRYDLKRCEDALRLIATALRRRHQRITSEP